MSFRIFSNNVLNRLSTKLHLSSIPKTSNNTIIGPAVTTTSSNGDQTKGILPSILINNNTNNNIFVRYFASKKHKKYIKYAKGYRGKSKNCFRMAIRRVHKAWQYAYRDRKNQRRDIKKLWIHRINSGVRQYNWRYSIFIPALQKTNIQLNRKILSNLAMYEPYAFKSIIDVINYEGKYINPNEKALQLEQQRLDELGGIEEEDPRKLFYGFDKTY